MNLRKLLTRWWAAAGFLLLLALLLGSDRILARQDLAWRLWVIQIALALLTLLFLIVAAQVFFRLLHAASAGRRLPGRILSGVAAVLLPVALCIIAVYGLLIYAFAIQPEHVVLRDNTPYVVRVNSFLDILLEYDAYHGRLVRGRTPIYQERYGSGGYDPFAGTPNVLP